ncbi:spore cortex-lytic enzyme precursor [Desulfosporosinus acididurans]|uniref:Spore cortex-lytic enzyme n=1 Tax=Desulfosporosinus acididurans TaxID=476652 RepID=A0A0J1FLV0_9FIRM|nr:cell wall hydrolase [Desulfosporosinus acididurans]KLU64347.1 spore cortex-lytic enzyme precursor [Desulfosporosinus acididurans]
MPHRRCRKSLAIFLCGLMCLFLWQADIYPVLGQDDMYEIIFVNSNTGPQSSRSNEPPPTKSTTKIPTYNIIVNNDQYENNKLSQDTPPPDTGHQVLSRSLGRFVTEEEVNLLSRVIYGEARGENFEGQVAVGAVVLNRLKDPHFPKTMWGVIYQPGAFTAVKDQQIHLDPNDVAYKAAEAALSGDDPTNGAIYYYNPRLTKDRWIKSRPVIKKIGNHTFSI